MRDPDKKRAQKRDHQRRVYAPMYRDLSARKRGRALTEYTARRSCLNCDRNFKSEGPWNRICPKCGALPEDKRPLRAPHRWIRDLEEEDEDA